MMCSANKHNLDVVGIAPPPPSRRGSGTCRGCKRDRDRDAKKGVRRRWELPEVFDLDTGMQIIDDIAIERAVNGGRIWTQEQTGIQPWITETEARIAAERMFNRGYEPTQIADHIGCSEADIYLWILGVEMAVAA